MSQEDIVTYLHVAQANHRLEVAQKNLFKSIKAHGLQPLPFSAGKKLTIFGDVLTRARAKTRGKAFVWCNSDVILTRNPYDVPNPDQVYGFYRRETPSGEFTRGVDMYYIPTRIWDEIISRDIPPLYLGASYVDRWISRLMEAQGAYQNLEGYIDHPSHPRSGAATSDTNVYYQKNFRAYNAWAQRNNLSPIDAPPYLIPYIGHVWGIRDIFRKLTTSQNQKNIPRLLFRKYCPAIIREKLIYPTIKITNQILQNTQNLFEPFRLKLETISTRFILRDERQVSRALKKVPPEWKSRIQDAIDCPDNEKIPRHPNAGKITGSVITMHNGILVRALSYYGSGILHLLIQNRGVHEPQEERAFAEILRYIEPESTILELGAYWGFYSLWFSKEIPQAQCYLVEPDPRNIEAGKQNFRLNNEHADFTVAAVGNLASTGLKQSKIISVDQFSKHKGIDHIHILHSDIQGAEESMLKGAKEKLAAKKIDFLFISTHGGNRHAACSDFLRNIGYQILCEASPSESYSHDGLIVAKSPEAQGPDHLEIAHKRSPEVYTKSET